MISVSLYLGHPTSAAVHSELFGALQLLKSAYRNGHISAGGLAAKHMDALIAELDADFGYNLESDTDLTED